MFNNIGVKIKNVAVISFGIGLLVGVIGIFFFIYSLAISMSIALADLLIWLTGTISPIIVSFPLYAFGQLVENTDSIVFLLSGESKISQNPSTNESNISATEKFLASATPTSPASTTLTTNSVNTQVTNQSSIMQPPAEIANDFKVFTCPHCGKKYKARSMSRVLCPHCHMKID